MVQSRADHLFIDGVWVPATGESFEVVSPATEEVIAHARLASEGDVDLAVAAARRAFDSGPWGRMPLEERLVHVGRLRDLLESEREQIAQVITSEMGCPIQQARDIQATAPVAAADGYLAAARALPFSEIRTWGSARALVTQEAVGVVAAVVPWNAPMGISVGKVVPALLAGCAVVLKPAPQTLLSGYLLAELVQRAGLPPGVVNVLAAERDASESLIAHPGVDKVTFTGSTAAGRRIAAICGRDLRRVTLELGGKSAAVVLDDADLAQTVEALRMGSFRNNGQICTLKTRVLVSKRRQGELVERLQALVASMPVGDPHEMSTQIGPVVSDTQRTRVESYIDAGRKEGATLVTGGGRPSGLDRGWYVEPTIFSDVTASMRIAQEEIFGPVLSVLTYDDENGAVAMANDSAFGLSGAVFTTDLEHGLSVASKMRTGVVEVNGAPIGLAAPFGGFKASGLGRENGREGLAAYLEPRSVGLPPEVVGA